MSICIHERIIVVVAIALAAFAFVSLVSRYVRGKRDFADALEMYRRSQGQDWS